MKNYFLCSVMLIEILTGGGVNVVYATNSSLMEITKEGQQAPVPKVAPLEAGRLENSQRTFDLSVIGKCKNTNNELKLDIQGRDVPELFAVNDEGNLVYAQPKPMSVITMPRGHSSWVEISLSSVKGSNDYVKKYMCLGIFKKNEEPYILYMPDPDNAAKNHPSETIDLWSGEAVELVPLVSTTDLNTACTVAEPGSEVNLENVSVSAFDFSSVFRVDVKVREEKWIQKSCDLYKIRSNDWSSDGGLGIGLVEDKNGLITTQLLMANYSTGRLACSLNGESWTDMGITIGKSSWNSCSVFGNNIWCIINWESSVGMRRSINYGKTWLTPTIKIGARNLHFAQGVFMTITNAGEVYSSVDADNWKQIGSVPPSDGYKILIYGNNKWICGTAAGHIYWSNDGTGSWNFISDDLDCGTPDVWFGGCFVNGYFYVIHCDGIVKRSPTGEVWTEVTSWNTSKYCHIGYYKNKLYAFELSGRTYHVGLPD